MTSPTTIKNRVSILVNGVTRLANEVFGSDLPVHAHHQHTELDHDDHLQYMLCSAGPSRPFTGVVYFEEGLALRGQVDLNFDDHYRALSAYPTPGIPLSLSAAEWTAFIANYGNASIIGAFNTARNPYTAGTAISITNHVVSNTGVISLCKLGQTPSGGAWSLVEGTNITITQDSVNKRLTIDGQAGGGAYDDSAVFYHSGSRPGTGDWTLYDGSDYHGIGGLVYLRGQADNQTSAFQQVSFTASDGILIEDRIVGSEPDPDRESSITLNQNEAISGAAILVAKLKDADGVLTFGADQSGVYWHDRILRESTDWGAGNSFLLADIVEETNPYDRLYAALGDQRMDLVNILALLAEGGGSVLLEEGAVGFGDAEGLLSGDATHLSWDDSVLRLKVGPGPAPQHLGEASGIMLTGHMECTGNEYLYGHLVLGANGAESKIQCLTGSVQFEDAYCDWTTKPRLSNSLAQYTAVKADFGGAEDSIFGYLHRLFSAVPGTATLQSAYEAGDTITIGANGPVEILADTATSGRGKCLFLRGTHANRIEPILDIKNDSTSNGPSIYFQGNAGANDYGHELLTADTLSIHSSFSGYDSSQFDAYCKVWQNDGEFGSKIAISILRADNDSAVSPPAYLSLSHEYGEFTDLSKAYLAARDVTIQAQSGGDVYLNTNGGGNITISPGTGYTDFGNKVARNFDSISFGSDDANTASFSSNTITASYASGSPDKTVSISANATLVTITKPVGISAGCTLIITASGADRTVQNFHDSVTEADFIIWINGEGNADTSAITIPSGKRGVVSLKWVSIGASPVAIGTFNLEI
jgi:hypothetical protein